MMFLFVHPLTPMPRDGDQKISLDDPWRTIAGNEALIFGSSAAAMRKIGEAERHNAIGRLTEAALNESFNKWRYISLS